jgi:hypothetical protein
MNDHPYVNVKAIGHCARKILQTEKEATVWGHTSKGIFAITTNKKVLFISHHPFRGPLTVNINEEAHTIQAITPNTHIQLFPDQIRFIPSGLSIGFNAHTPIWTSIVQDIAGIDLDACIHRSKEIGDELSNQLSSLETNRTISTNGTVNFPDRTEMKNTLSSSFSAQNEAAVYDCLYSLLGFGGGLTPTGDDIICGFLLAANAWKEILAPNFELEETINHIVKTAWEKTTVISANLIACASSGRADERIINCMNWLTRGGLSSSLIIEELLSYGSSSGLDTLAGMLAFIQTSPPVHQKL